MEDKKLSDETMLQDEDRYRSHIRHDGRWVFRSRSGWEPDLLQPSHRPHVRLYAGRVDRSE